MVNYSMLTSFYDELIKEISITCVPVRMNYKRWLSFEQVAKKLILDTYQSQEPLPGVLFPCVRQSPSDELRMGRITSLQFVLLFHFHVEQLDRCRELSTRLFGKTSQSSKINIPPVNGFPFACIADDSIDNSGIWLGRRLQCYDDNGKLICTLLSTCVEQLLLKHQGESNIWNTSPFSSAIIPTQTNYYFHDQFRKNAYWGGDSEEAYQIFCQQLFNPRYFWGQLEVRRVYLKYSSLAEYIDSVRADTNLSIQAARIIPPIGPAADRYLWNAISECCETRNHIVSFTAPCIRRERRENIQRGSHLSLFS